MQDASACSRCCRISEMKTFFTDLLQKGQWVDGSPLNEEERASITSDRMMAERYESIPSGFDPVLPTITIEQRLMLRRGARTIDVRFLGRGHTDGDLIVYVPEDGVLMTGDLVVWPVPLVGSTSFPLDYATTLDALGQIRAAIIVPGHGPVFHDDAYLKQVSELLTSLVISDARRGGPWRGARAGAEERQPRCVAGSVRRRQPRPPDAVLDLCDRPRHPACLRASGRTPLMRTGGQYEPT